MNFSVRFYNSETKDLFVTFFSEVISAQNFKLNIDTGEIRNFYNDFIRPLPTIFPLNYFITKKITFKSRDNKDVPITIIHKKNIVLDGTNPTLLKAYGGFGVVSGPNYDTGLLYFLEQGGVYAFAEIRGGGEKGLKWHKDAVGLKKMNSFNDFIDASEFLINEKYTSPDKLAISGGSYGGLVVGVAITQRPDLYKVAIPEMGVFDMLTYSEYSVGKFHLDEFGDPEKKPDFNYLLGYSPYNKVKEDVNYPTTLLITGENDDRVPPFNSYKFAAALQNRTAQKNPVFLKTLGNSGHYGKNSTYQSRINESAEFYGFLLYYLTK
jgi:prolyl oligopeptidase